jgi:hypothetical protein
VEESYNNSITFSGVVRLGKGGEEETCTLTGTRAKAIKRVLPLMFISAIKDNFIVHVNYN